MTFNSDKDNKKDSLLIEKNKSFFINKNIQLYNKNNNKKKQKKEKHKNSNKFSQKRI